jgi:ribonuclease P protein component
LSPGVLGATQASRPVYRKRPRTIDLQQHCSGVVDQVQRLKTRAQFQAVLAGNTLARTPHFALHCTGLDTTGTNPAAMHPSTPLKPAAQNRSTALFSVDDVWLGAMVPKRWAKRAVTRNTIKRQIYSVVDGFEPVLKQAAHVVRLRSSFDKKQFVSATSVVLKEAVRAELTQLLMKATRAVESP